jgi:2-haloalkanoic acid dehalogenase type II
MAGVTAVIFDVFETLVPNPQERWQETFGDVVRTQALGIRPSELQRLWKDLENKFRQERTNLDDPEKSPPFKTYEQAWRECFEAVFAARGLKGDGKAAANFCVRDMASRRPFPEAIEVLKKLQEHYKLAIISNADNAYLDPIAGRIKAAGVNLAGVFSSERLKAYKPSQLAFTKPLAELGLKASECVYVGDQQFDDIFGAHRVGMKTVWVNRGEAQHLRADLPKPDHTVTSLSDVVKVVEAVKA